MRVLIAPDCFTGTLTAAQAAEAIAAGWAEQAPHDELATCPLSDGGPGFVDTLAGTLGGTLEAVTVTGPLGEPVPAAAAARRGRPRTSRPRRPAGCTWCRPTGATPARPPRPASASWSPPRSTAAPAASCSGSAAPAPTTAVPGCWPPSAPATRRRSAAAASRSPTSRPTPSPSCPRCASRLRGVRLVVASDVDVPLLGLQGASAGFAAQKGATPEQAQRLEAALGRFADVAVRALGDDARPDLLAGAGAAGRRPSPAHRRRPGPVPPAASGSALLLLGGHRVPGSAAVLDAVGFDDLLAGTDLVVTGEGSVRLAVAARQGRQRRRRAGARGRRPHDRGGGPGGGRAPRDHRGRHRVGVRGRRDRRGAGGVAGRPRRHARGAGATGRAHLVAARPR